MMTPYEKRLDPQIAAALQQMPPAFDAKAELHEIRRNVEAMFMANIGQILPPHPDVMRTDRVIPGSQDEPEVRVRIYQAKQQNNKPVPAFLWIHGGGFFLGISVDNQSFCEQVVLETGAVVVSVDYRLAPEHHFPAALEDCYAALKWLAYEDNKLHVDVTRIAIGGVSAGGNLAAATALMARDRGEPALCYQFLLVPGLDDRLVTTSSYEVTDLRVWNRDIACKAWAAYLVNSEDAVSLYAAPARATDLSGLPPAYIYVEGQDLLRDEDIEYAMRLMQAGVPTELHVYPGMFHGAYAFAPQADMSKRATLEHLSTLKRVLCEK